MTVATLLPYAPLHTTPAPGLTDPACRLCGARMNRTLIDLGVLPLTNRTALPDDDPDPAYPLHVRICDNCTLAQIPDVASPATLAAPHPFLSARSAMGRGRAERFASATLKRQHFGPDSLVIEIGSNDGTLLRHFHAAGIPVLGIEPAPHPAAEAARLGIPTEPAPFDTELAMEIAVRHGRADLIVVNHVLQYVPDLFDFAAGLACILRPNGIINLEVPYLHAILRTAEFDAIRHDTYTYLSLRVLEQLFRSVGLRAFDAERLPEHGGSLRVLACHATARHDAKSGLKAIHMAEGLYDLNDTETANFADRVTAARDGIRAFVQSRCVSGRTVVAYGASTRGGMLLNVCGIGTESIPRIADPDATKHGTVLPGCRIPIVSLSELSARAADDILILPWPNASDALGELASLQERGAQLWTPLPHVSLV